MKQKFKLISAIMLSCIAMASMSFAQTTNYVPKWNGAWVNTVTPIFEDATNSRIGIGTTTPASKLDVEGGISIGATYSGTTAAPTNGAIIEGNVGIGTSSPSELLHLGGTTDKCIRINSSTGNAAFYGSYMDYLLFGVNRNPASGSIVDAGKAAADIAIRGANGSGYILFETTNTNNSAPSEKVRINGDGNVGIGTTTPGSKLEVSGQIKITGGSPGAGKVLASDANGLASWSTVGENGGWSLTGNASTVDGTNFIGTTDNIPFNIRVNNQKAGRIDQTLANTFWGYQAGNANTIGTYNTVNGSQSLYSNTTASQNIAIGGQALYTQSFGNSGTAWNTDNVAIGYKALWANQPTTATNGWQNTSIGNYALYSNTTGYRNTAIGFQALYSNTTGVTNVANGLQALYSNTTGYANTANGTGTLYSNTIGFENTANGSGALQNNISGSYNTANGLFALLSNTSGGYNTADGYYTLQTITTGSYNTALGYQANVDNNARTNSITIAGNGNLALGGDNRVRIGNSSMSSIGGQVGWTTISDERVKENVTDNVKGLAFIMKLKPVTYNYSIAKSNGIQGKEGKDEWAGKNDIEKMLFSGFLSQEVEKAAKESDYNFSGVDKPQDANGLWGLRYAEFTVPLVKAVQEQQKMIDSLNKTTTSLKKNMSQQDSVIAALKKQMDQFASLVTANNPTQAYSSANLTEVELSNKNVIVLDQNIPNPFAEQTIISYYLPDNVARAQIIFFDQSGKIIKTVDLTEKGKGTLNIFANDLSNGIYTYSLIVDGQTQETKKMVKAK